MLLCEGLGGVRGNVLNCFEHVLSVSLTKTACCECFDVLRLERERGGTGDRSGAPYMKGINHAYTQNIQNNKTYIYNY